MVLNTTALLPEEFLSTLVEQNILIGCTILRGYVCSGLVSGLSVLVSWKGVTERCSKRMSLVAEYQLLIFDSCAKMFGGSIVPKARNYALLFRTDFGSVAEQA